MSSFFGFGTKDSPLDNNFICVGFSVVSLVSRTTSFRFCSCS